MSCGVDGAMREKCCLVRGSEEWNELWCGRRNDERSAAWCGDRVSLLLPRRVISCFALGIAIVLVHDVVGADQELGETTRVQGECE
jgi:hypothetical protein